MAAWIRMIADEDADADLLEMLKLARTPHGTVDNVMRVHALRPSTMRGHVFGHDGADPLRGTGDAGDFAFETFHLVLPGVPVGWEQWTARAGTVTATCASGLMHPPVWPGCFPGSTEDREEWTRYPSIGIDKYHG